nr:hypothetical protein Iba_chr08dCG10370 [Ipomoea batatas]
MLVSRGGETASEEVGWLLLRPTAPTSTRRSRSLRLEAVDDGNLWRCSEVWRRFMVTMKTTTAACCGRGDVRLRASLSDDAGSLDGRCVSGDDMSQTYGEQLSEALQIVTLSVNVATWIPEAVARRRQSSGVVKECGDCWCREEEETASEGGGLAFLLRPTAPTSTRRMIESLRLEAVDDGNLLAFAVRASFIDGPSNLRASTPSRRSRSSRPKAEASPPPPTPSLPPRDTEHRRDS